MPDFVDCLICDGAGHVEGEITLDCGTCRGKGQIRIDDEYARTSTDGAIYQEAEAA